MAVNGADIFIDTPQNAITFDSHSHTYSFAINDGGSIYYYDPTISKVATITFNMATGSVSSYGGILTYGNGGLIYISVTFTLNINIISSVFSNNTASKAASHIFIQNSITDALNFVMTNSQVSSSQAAYNAGFLYLANTATLSNIQITGSSFTGITAGSNGGLFDIEAYNGNTVIIVSSSITTVRGNNGGCFYILGGTTNFIVQSSSTITSCLSSSDGGVAYISSGVTTSITVEGSSTISNSYCNGDGGVFYSYISGVNTLTVTSSKITQSTSNTG